MIQVVAPAKPFRDEKNMELPGGLPQHWGLSVATSAPPGATSRVPAGPNDNQPVSAQLRPGRAN